MLIVKIGIGVDDVFVIVQNWDNIGGPTNRDHPVPENIAKALKTAVSILIYFQWTEIIRYYSYFKKNIKVKILYSLWLTNSTFFSSIPWNHCYSNETPLIILFIFLDVINIILFVQKRLLLKRISANNNYLSNIKIMKVANNCLSNFLLNKVIANVGSIHCTFNKLKIKVNAFCLQGVSILVTSITDVCAFLIGATTILPALRSFCIFAGIGVLAVFILTCTFYIAWLALDARRWVVSFSFTVKDFSFS